MSKKIAVGKNLPAKKKLPGELSKTIVRGSTDLPKPYRLLVASGRGFFPEAAKLAENVKLFADEMGVTDDPRVVQMRSLYEKICGSNQSYSPCIDLLAERGDAIIEPERWYYLLYRVAFLEELVQRLLPYTTIAGFRIVDRGPGTTANRDGDSELVIEVNRLMSTRGMSKESAFSFLANKPEWKKRVRGRAEDITGTLRNRYDMEVKTQELIEYIDEARATKSISADSACCSLAKIEKWAKFAQKLKRYYKRQDLDASEILHKRYSKRKSI